MINSGADDLFLLTIFDVLYVPKGGNEVLNKNSAIGSGCSRVVCLICLDIVFNHMKELYVKLTWKIKSFLYFMAWHTRRFKLLPVHLLVDHFSILVEALQLLSVLTDHP